MMDDAAAPLLGGEGKADAEPGPAEPAAHPSIAFAASALSGRGLSTSPSVRGLTIRPMTVEDLSLQMKIKPLYAMVYVFLEKLLPTVPPLTLGELLLFFKVVFAEVEKSATWTGEKHHEVCDGK